MISCFKDIFYELNPDDLTAKIVYSPDASICYQSRKYIIQSINEGSFQENFKIQSIKFEEGSLVKSIGKEAFSYSSLECLSIPSSVEELKEGWCKGALNLNRILLSTKNNFFSYLPTNKKMIVGKSEPENENYDVLIFACRDINEAIIPPSIKFINSFAFNGCNQLFEIHFTEDSKLISIDKCAFSDSSLRCIAIPSHVKQIGEGSFSECKYLHTINFPNDSKLTSIGSYAFFHSLVREISIPKQVTKIGDYSFFRCNELHSATFSEDSEIISIDEYAFSRTRIEKIYLPSKVEKLKEGWCGYSLKLNQIDISSKNKNFFYLDQNKKVIVEKSDSKSEFYDIINFACRDIESVVISSSIKHICSFAFYGCKNLQTAELSENSKLLSIGKKAFANSSIKIIFIPKNVKNINYCCFSECENLKTIQFSEDSELEIISKEAFSKSSIEIITIPRNVDRICEQAFSECRFLKEIKFAKNSKINLIEKLAFYNSSLESIKIPQSIKKIERRAFSDCKNILHIEFLSDNLIIDRFCFKDSSNLIIASFPNAEKINISNDSFSRVSNNFSLFIPGCASFIFYS